MSSSSADFLDGAKYSLQKDDEIGFRCAISRGYYAMYHEALASLKHVPNYLSNHHGNLIGYMTTSSEHKSEPYESRMIRVLGYNLKQQRDARNEADYHISQVTVTKEMAETSVEAAQLFFTKWSDLKSAKAS